MVLAILLSLTENEDERTKIRKLFKKHRQRMYAVAYSILKDKHDAEDAVSAAMIRIIRNLHCISGLDTVRTRSFISVVTKNAAIDIYNKRKRSQHEELDGIFMESDEDTETSVINSFDAEAVNNALNELSDSYRDILMLRYYSDMRIADISNALGISESAVKHRISRALEKMRQLLEGKING